MAIRKCTIHKGRWVLFFVDNAQKMQAFLWMDGRGKGVEEVRIVLEKGGRI